MRGLIAAGLARISDIDAVVAMIADSGAVQDGLPTKVLAKIVRDKFGRETTRFTTALHASREMKAMNLARAAAADKSSALISSAINAAAARSNLDFNSDHGRAQKAAMIKLGTGGRLGMAIGVAGAGKTAMLTPLVECWHAQGRVVFGTAIAWRQAQDLDGSGIPAKNCLALAALLARTRSGLITLNESTVVVLDEVGLTSTHQFLEILELREKCNFTLVGIGDPLQAHAVDAGSVIELLQRALGSDEIPAIETSVRQTTEIERRLAGLFRDSRAEEALHILRERGRARLSAGSYDDAIQAVTNLWQARTEANQVDPEYRMLVMAPTNSDARAISAAIRLRRRASGDIGADKVLVDAADQSGTEYELALAIGDRVRLFGRVNAAGSGTRGLLGVNGSVLTVLAIADDGITLRNTHGRSGLVHWATLRDPVSSRIRLAYGDCATIDASQGATATEAIFAAPGGLASVDAGRAYVAASRHKKSFYIVVGEAAIRRDVAARRALGDVRPIGNQDLWAAIATRLNSRTERSGAVEFLERTHTARQNAVAAFQTTLAMMETRVSRSLLPTNVAYKVSVKRFVPIFRRLVEVLDTWSRNLASLALQLRGAGPQLKAVSRNASHPSRGIVKRVSRP